MTQPSAYVKRCAFATQHRASLESSQCHSKREKVRFGARSVGSLAQLAAHRSFVAKGVRLMRAHACRPAQRTHLHPLEQPRRRITAAQPRVSRSSTPPVIGQLARSLGSLALDALFVWLQRRRAGYLCTALSFTGYLASSAGCSLAKPITVIAAHGQPIRLFSNSLTALPCPRPSSFGWPSMAV